MADCPGKRRGGFGVAGRPVAGRRRPLADAARERAGAIQPGPGRPVSGPPRRGPGFVPTGRDPASRGRRLAPPGPSLFGLGRDARLSRFYTTARAVVWERDFPAPSPGRRAVGSARSDLSAV